MDQQSLIPGITSILFPSESFPQAPSSGVLEKLHSELEVEWKISNVFTEDQNCKCFVSPSFHFLDAEWRLLLFGEFLSNPKFTSDSPADNPSLVLLRSEDYCSTVEYSFEWIKFDGSVEQLFKKVMKSDQKRGDYCCVSLAEILKQNSNPRDVTITLTVKLETLEKGPSRYKNLKRLETLSTNFKDLFSSKQCYDTTLRVRDKEYKTHKAVLVARSSVFASMFRPEMSENQSSVITLVDCDPDSFERFLEYLYCGKIDAMCPSSAIALHEIALKYDVHELKEFCNEYLIGSFTNEDFCDVVIFADKLNDENLISVAQDFFKKNVDKICMTSAWKSLLEKNNTLANKLLKSTVNFEKKLK